MAEPLTWEFDFCSLGITEQSRESVESVDHLPVNLNTHLPTTSVTAPPVSILQSGIKHAHISESVLMSSIYSPLYQVKQETFSNRSQLLLKPPTQSVTRQRPQQQERQRRNRQVTLATSTASST